LKSEIPKIILFFCDVKFVFKELMMSSVNIHQNIKCGFLKILKTEIPFLSRQKNEDEVASEY
jgi:hypothetical protein